MLKNKQSKLNKVFVAHNSNVRFFANSNRVEDKNKANNILKTEFVVDRSTIEANKHYEAVSGENFTNETLKTASKAFENQKKQITKWYNLSFVLFNLIAIFALLIYQINTITVLPLNKIEGLNPEFLIYASLIFALIMLIESFQTYILIHAATKRSAPIISYKSSAIQKYYNGVCTVGSKGQMLEVDYLHRFGIEPVGAIAAPLVKTFFSSICLVLASVVFLILNSLNLYQFNRFVIILASVSLAIGGVLIILLILFMCSKKLMPKLLLNIIHFLHTIKLIKNPNTLFNKCMRKVFEYKKSIKIYSKHIFVTIVSFLSCAIVTLLKPLVLVMIYCMFTEIVTMQVVLQIFALYFIIELVLKLVPFPSGAGIAEFVFTILFATIFASGVLFWAMVIYRILNYFVYMLQGLMVLGYDFIYGTKRYKKRLLKQQKDNK